LSGKAIQDHIGPGITTARFYLKVQQTRSQLRKLSERRQIVIAIPRLRQTKHTNA
jgi:hypothetical protein